MRDCNQVQDLPSCYVIVKIIVVHYVLANRGHRGHMRLQFVVQPLASMAAPFAGFDLGACSILQGYRQQVDDSAKAMPLLDAADGQTGCFSGLSGLATGGKALHELSARPHQLPARPQCSADLHPFRLADFSYPPVYPQLPHTVPLPTTTVSAASLLAKDPSMPGWQPPHLLGEAAAGMGNQWHATPDSEHNAESNACDGSTHHQAGSPYHQAGSIHHQVGSPYHQAGSGDANKCSSGGSSSGRVTKATVKDKKESVRRVNTDMLEEGGYFDMPILVRLPSC